MQRLQHVTYMKRLVQTKGNDMNSADVVQLRGHSSTPWLCVISM